MAADDLATQGTRASAAIGLLQFFQNILASESQGLTTAIAVFFTDTQQS